MARACVNLGMCVYVCVQCHFVQRIMCSGVNRAGSNPELNLCLVRFNALALNLQLIILWLYLIYYFRCCSFNSSFGNLKVLIVLYFCCALHIGLSYISLHKAYHKYCDAPMYKARIISSPCHGNDCKIQRRICKSADGLRPKQICEAPSTQTVQTTSPLRRAK